MNKFILIVAGWLISIALPAQSGKIIRFSSAYAMFPDTARAKGHNYNGKHYDAATHYSDSSVLVYVPKDFSSKGKLNLVFWFHGWGNNIDTACKQYRLLEQFDASGRNAVFVFPEGPKNAPDSYGGKLEQPAVFQQLTRHVIDQLALNKVIAQPRRFDIAAYDITLAGHSGAYRVISRIINRSPVKEVILFDAMYGANDAYLQWLSDPANRFINIYTKDGGTYDNSLQILKKLTDSLRVPAAGVVEADASEQVLRANNKLFIFSEQSHNGVIIYQENWARFLRNIPGKKQY
jgi:predicted esterase